MIEWQEHSTVHERKQLADDLDASLELMYAAQREEIRAKAKVARQKKPANVLKAEQALQVAEAAVRSAQSERTAAMRTMCHVHVDINIDDIVELVDTAGERKREPIVVETVEFHREANGDFYLRVKGILLAESETGRPQLSQGFDLREFDPHTRIIKHN